MKCSSIYKKHRFKCGNYHISMCYCSLKRSKSLKKNPVLTPSSVPAGPHVRGSPDRAGKAGGRRSRGGARRTWAAAGGRAWRAAGRCCSTTASPGRRRAQFADAHQRCGASQDGLHGGCGVPLRDGWRWRGARRWLAVARVSGRPTTAWIAAEADRAPVRLAPHWIEAEG